MTKNTKTILLSLLACLLLITGFELGEGRLRFGGATLNDSLTSRVTINKGLQVNGVITSSDTLRTSGILRSTELQLTGASPQIYWTTYGMYIDGSIDALTYNANAHAINTEAGTSLLYADSAGGLEYQVQRGGDYWNGALLKTKFIRGISPTGNSTVTYAHGITDGRIISMSCYLRHDTTLTTASNTARNWGVPPNNGYQTDLVYYAGFDSLYVWARFPATSTATRSDSLYFLVQYWD